MLSIFTMLPAFYGKVVYFILLRKYHPTLIYQILYANMSSRPNLSVNKAMLD